MLWPYYYLFSTTLYLVHLIGDFVIIVSLGIAFGFVDALRKFENIEQYSI